MKSTFGKHPTRTSEAKKRRQGKKHDIYGSMLAILSSHKSQIKAKLAYKKYIKTLKRLEAKNP